MSGPFIPPRPPYDIAYTAAGGLPRASDVLDVEAARKSADLTSAEFVLAKHPHLVHADIAVPAVQDLDHNSITLATFQTKASTNRRRSAVLYAHGGGQVVGNRFHSLVQWLSLVLPLNDNIFLASVEYRRAPEHQAPAGAYDCYAALVYLTEHADELGIDPENIIVYGISGGAPLAAATCLLARNRNGPKACAQILSIPMLDDRDHWPSHKQFETNTLWPGFIDRQAWDMVLGSDRNGPNVDEIRSPGRAIDLSNLPPTYIDVGECEVFRDSAVDFATRIWKAGGSAELHVWAGMYHGGWIFEPDVTVSQMALRAQRDFIERALGLSSGCLSRDVSESSSALPLGKAQ
jgi:acetyl esterase/lipase